MDQIGNVAYYVSHFEYFMAHFRLRLLSCTHMPKALRSSLLLLSAFVLPIVGNAGPVYYLSTGQGTANTTIDKAPHTDEWAPTSVAAACSTPSCEPQVFT